MTDHKSDLSLSEVKALLESQIAIGDMLATCPLCSQYLSLVEFKTNKCFGCKKKIKFESILYYPGAKKENN